MEIVKIDTGKKDYLDLLLIADEQEDMIDRYLESGDMYALYDGGLKGVCVVTKESEDVCELKNIAVYEQFRGKGYGKAMVRGLFEKYESTFKTMLVGTGDIPFIVGFYKNCGFEYSHKIKNFFTDNYEKPMFEDGIKLIDMVYYKKEI